MERNPQQPVRVLIIENEPAQTGLLSRALSAAGREMIIAVDGPKGLELARTGVGLVVADYDLPGMNGVELVRRLRAEKITAPVIIVSGVANVTVNMVFDPAWTPERMSDLARVALDWY